MKIKDIYQKYKVLPNLEKHLVGVAKVGTFITDHWQGPEIDKSLIQKTCLLHDLGNIVKFKLKKYPQFLGEEQKRLDYWLKIQTEMIKKYGPEDHWATLQMLEELKINSGIKKIILSKGFTNSVKIENFGPWEVKIVFYADQRVGPHGVIPLKERLEEGLGRYTHYRHRESIAALIKACYQIEKQIQKNLDVNVSTITGESIEKNDDQFLNLEI